MSIPIIDAEVFLECQNELGEGILWDSKKQLLHWVDLTQAEVHSLEPSSKKYSVDKYPESRFVTAIALRKGQPGFLALIQDSVVILPQTEPTQPFAKTFKKTEQKSSETLQKPQFGDAPGKLVRFNDGAASPDGRYFAGSMALPEHRGKAREGELWRLDTDGKMTKVLSEVGTSNGIGWSLDHKTMYFIDSHADRIDQFDYDISTGEISNRRQFAVSPPPTDDKTPTRGVPDGLSMDGNGNIWVARWMDSRVIGYRPDGSIICFIRCKEALSPTIPCFGGPNLDVMYIATAHSKMAGLNGDIQKDMPHSGDLYKVDFGPDSEVRKILGENWKGAERFRYGASGGSRM